MNQMERVLISDLLSGNKIRLTRNIKGKDVVKVFSSDNSPLYYMDTKRVPGINKYLKRDKRGWYTLNLSLIRQQHGNSWIKREYKKAKSTK